MAVVLARVGGDRARGPAAVSWLGDLGALQDTLGSEGAETYARGAILNYGARAGYSANATLGMLRQAGVGFRRQDALATFRGIKAQIAAGQTAAMIPVDATTGEILPGTPPDNWTGRYVHQVTATFRSRQEDGTYAVTQRSLGLLSGQPLSPGEAARAALGILETPVGEDSEERYPGVGDVLSLQLTGAWYQTRRGATAA